MIIGFWGAVYFVCRSKQPKRNNTKKNLFFFFFFLFCSRMLLLSQLDQNSQIEAPDNNSSSSIPNRSPRFFSFFCVCVCVPRPFPTFFLFSSCSREFFFSVFLWQPREFSFTGADLFPRGSSLLALWPVSSGSPVSTHFYSACLLLLLFGLQL